MEIKEKKPSGQAWANFKQFMWNPRTREFMGRTGSSWALILLFYLVFYAFLTALFSLTMWVMLQTIDEYTPQYTDRLSNPGLMIRPKTDSLDIVYNKSDSSSWNASVSALNEFLSSYNDSLQVGNNVPCNLITGYNTQHDSGDVRNYPKTACQFNRSTFGSCSGDDDPTFGYSEGRPCVLIKMNRVINFKPEPLFTNQTYVTVNCSAPKSADGLNATYFPSSSKADENTYGIISLKYFPYYGKKAQTNYTQPIVAIQFNNLTVNTDYNIKCAIYAKNIAFETRDSFAGRVSFRLRVNQ
ncbi:sodium/potassium-transporting ATPase subunit beta-2 [Lissotriton helveticus]